MEILIEMTGMTQGTEAEGEKQIKIEGEVPGTIEVASTELEIGVTSISSKNMTSSFVKILLLS